MDCRRRSALVSARQAGQIVATPGSAGHRRHGKVSHRSPGLVSQASRGMCCLGSVAQAGLAWVGQSSFGDFKAPQAGFGSTCPDIARIVAAGRGRHGKASIGWTREGKATRAWIVSATLGDAWQRGLGSDSDRLGLG
jgi:hypothetical protein